LYIPPLKFKFLEITLIVPALKQAKRVKY